MVIEMDSEHYWFIRIRKPPKPKRVLKWIGQHGHFIIPSIYIVGFSFLTQGEFQGYFIGLAASLLAIINYLFFKPKDC